MKKHKIDCTCGKNVGLVPEPLLSAGRLWKIAVHQTPDEIRCTDSGLAVPVPAGLL